MPPVVVSAAVEQKLEEILMQQNHLLLLIGLVVVIYALKYSTPISKWLFSDSWKWLIAPINIGLAFFGIFVLKLTDLQQANVKAMVALIIAGAATISWEWVIKYIDQYLRSKFNAPPAPPVAPTP